MVINNLIGILSSCLEILFENIDVLFVMFMMWWNLDFWSWRIVCDINKNFSAMVTKPFQLWLQNFGYKQLGNIVVNHEILFAILMYCLWCCFIFMTKYHVYIPKCQVNVSHLATWHCFFPQCLEIGISNFKITRLYTRPAGQVGGIKTVYKERFNYSRGHIKSYIRSAE